MLKYNSLQRLFYAYVVKIIIQWSEKNGNSKFRYICRELRKRCNKIQQM